MIPAPGPMTRLALSRPHSILILSVTPAPAILRIGDAEVGDEPMALLEKYLQDGTPMPITVVRDGKQVALTVTPLPK